jgi:hypothetical protein
VVGILIVVIAIYAAWHSLTSGSRGLGEPLLDPATGHLRQQ